MNNSTTIVNHLNTDRVTEINISERKYIVFTLSYRNLIIIDYSNKDKPILLLNRTCNNRKKLLDEFDKIIITATKVNNNEDFLSKLDTYIDLSEYSNETTEEILAVYKIILEDYKID